MVSRIPPCSAKTATSSPSKSTEARTNEVLAMVVAHNLCVLIQSFYELGVDPVFSTEPAGKPVAC